MVVLLAENLDEIMVSLLVANSVVPTVGISLGTTGSMMAERKVGHEVGLLVGVKVEKKVFLMVS